MNAVGTWRDLCIQILFIADTTLQMISILWLIYLQLNTFCFICKQYQSSFKQDGY